jgi:hypothetical protein
MSIPGSASPLLLASTAAAGAYQVSRSLRFNSADSAYLSKLTWGTSTNAKKGTFSLWVKRSGLGSTRYLVYAYDGSAGNSFGIYFVSDDTIRFQFGGSSVQDIVTSAVFRDPSAWYHLVLVWDTTDGTPANRTKIYVNNVQQTLSTANYPTQNANAQFPSTVDNFIGFTNTATFSGYLANIHFIDGQALTPSSFTETDATTGQLIPKTYTGSYGTNGFNLLFADNSSNTAATLGKDTSGLSNNWTPNNLSVTAGVGNDSLVDSPTNYGTDTGVGGEVRGNYATWNPLNASGTLSDGNLQGVTSTGGTRSLATTVSVSSGKFYVEIRCSNVAVGSYGANLSIGVSLFTFPIDSNSRNYSFADGVTYYADGTKYVNGSNSSYGASYATGDIIGIAINIDSNQITFYKNGVSQGAISKTFSGAYVITVTEGDSTQQSTVILNAGQRAFAYTAPSGFKALCTQNLPEGTITTSGSFTGNASADGPFVYLNGVPTAMTINSNAVTFATHADKLSNGFKVRSSSASYNTSGSNTYSITTTGDKFKYARAQPNP